MHGLVTLPQTSHQAITVMTSFYLCALEGPISTRFTLTYGKPIDEKANMFNNPFGYSSISSYHFCCVYNMICQYNSPITCVYNVVCQ